MPSTKKNYDKPELRERIKAKVMKGDKGGRPGQWSARKAQRVAHEYEAAGGGYKGPPAENQKHLQQWTEEDWKTKDDKPAVQGKTTHRYLPKKAWDKLSPSETKATDKKKVAGSKRGKQFVANTPAARKARRTSTATKLKSAKTAARKSSGPASVSTKAGSRSARSRARPAGKTR